MAVHRGTAGPPSHTHDHVVGPLQWVVQEPVEQPPIDSGEGCTYLPKRLSRELAPCLAPHKRRFRHRGCRFLRPLVRQMMRFPRLRDTSDGCAAEPLLPATSYGCHCRASSGVVCSPPLHLQGHAHPPPPLLCSSSALVAWSVRRSAGAPASFGSGRPPPRRGVHRAPGCGGERTAPLPRQDVAARPS